MNTDPRKDIADKMTELAEKRNNAYFGFIKNILIMASSLIGILVSLHKEKCDNDFSRYSFILTLIFCIIGIICLTFTSSYEYVNHRQMFEKIKAEYSRMVAANDFTFREIWTKKSRIYDTFETIGFFCLVICLVFLLLYGISIS